MVLTLCKDGSLLKTSLWDVYNCLCYPIGRTLRPSVDCGMSGGRGGGTFYPSGGQFVLVQNVRGDNPPSHTGFYVRFKICALFTHKYFSK